VIKASPFFLLLAFVFSLSPLIRTEFWSQTKLCLRHEQRQRRKSAASNPTPLDLTPSTSLEVNVSVPPPPAPPVLHQTEESRVPEAEQEQSKDVAVEEAPAAPAQASVLPPGVPSEELAAIKIQTAFRGYLVMRNQFWIIRSGDCWKLISIDGCINEVFVSSSWLIMYLRFLG
jgi:hypothetical protein